MNTLPLDFNPPRVLPKRRKPYFGETYDPARDRDRLNAQGRRVFEAMRRAPRWWTLRELEDATGDPQASISARLRDFRNVYGWTVEKRRRAGQEERGVWEYSLILPGEQP